MKSKTAMATPTLHCLSATFLSLAVLLTGSTAQDHPIDLSVEWKTSNSAMVKWEWTGTNSTKAARFAITVNHDNTGALLINETINVETNSFVIHGLDFSRTYTVELRVLDNTGKTVGVESVSVSTNYAWNDKFIVALSVIGFIALVPIVLLILQAVCLSEDKLQRARSYKNREV